MESDIGERWAEWGIDFTVLPEDPTLTAAEERGFERPDDYTPAVLTCNGIGKGRLDSETVLVRISQEGLGPQLLKMSKWELIETAALPLDALPDEIRQKVEKEVRGDGGEGTYTFRAWANPDAEEPEELCLHLFEQDSSILS